jgi:hypothetical protein
MPGPLQTAAIALSAMLPLFLFGYARIGHFRSAGRLYRAGCLTLIGVFAVTCVALPGQREVQDVLDGLLLLMTAMLLCYVFWALIAWGFTVTLLTAIAGAKQPLTLEQWIAAYTQGGHLSGFAHNRLHLLIGSGLAISRDGSITVTPFGIIVARLIRVARLASGLG